MVIEGTTRALRYPRYAGLRMSADEYLALNDDGYRYELVHGVVLMSPGPSFHHQDLASRVFSQIDPCVTPRKLGKLVYETDVRFSADTVYHPDIVYFSAARARSIRNTPTTAPELIVEFVSPRTRALDLRTKRDDYERFGVLECWVIGMEEAWQFVLRDGKFEERTIKGGRIECEAIAGFVLDLDRARAEVGAGESEDEDA